MSERPCAAARFQETPTDFAPTDLSRQVSDRLCSSVASSVLAFFRATLEEFAAAAGRPNDC